VFGYARAKGLRPNPLYLQGMSRVGCFPCINANKLEIAAIAKRYPEVVEKLLRWEAIVAAASKSGQATFFASDVTPEGAAMGDAAHRARLQGDDAGALSPVQVWPSAAEVFDWARTSRGGKQYNLFALMDDGLSCSSQYGLCE